MSATEQRADLAFLCAGLFGWEVEEALDFVDRMTSGKPQSKEDIERAMDLLDHFGRATGREGHA